MKYSLELRCFAPGFPLVSQLDQIKMAVFVYFLGWKHNFSFNTTVLVDYLCFRLVTMVAFTGISLLYIRTFQKKERERDGGGGGGGGGRLRGLAALFARCSFFILSSFLD